jgi:catechol 2,3-dioxygenase-like lactoylglutathione lyase family enzyme
VFTRTSLEADLFAGIAVSNFDRAVDWYERLLGEPRTFEATDTEYVWTLSEHPSIDVELLPERAGHAMVTAFLADPHDLDRFVEPAVARHLHPETTQTYGNGVRKVIYRDPDGNEVGFGGLPVEDGAAEDAAP